MVRICVPINACRSAQLILLLFPLLAVQSGGAQSPTKQGVQSNAFSDQSKQQEEIRTLANNEAKKAELERRKGELEAQKLDLENKKLEEEIAKLKVEVPALKTSTSVPGQFLPWLQVLGLGSVIGGVLVLFAGKSLSSVQIRKLQQDLEYANEDHRLQQAKLTQDLETAKENHDLQARKLQQEIGTALGLQMRGGKE